MGKLILHIGSPKTGTTSLQKFFYDNRKTMPSVGVAYPIFTPQPSYLNTFIVSKIVNGRFLHNYSLIKAERISPDARINDFDQNMMTLERAFSDEGSVLLSDEGFFFDVPKIDFENLLDRKKLLWITVAYILNELHVSNLLIILYLRRQDYLMASDWKQNIKSGIFTCTIDEFCALDWNHYRMDYAGLIDCIAEAFGSFCKIVIRPYGKFQFAGNDICHDFFNAAAIPWNKDFVLPEKDENSSISYDVAEALRLFLARAPISGDLRRKALVPKAYELTRMNPDPPGTTPFSEDKAKALVAPYFAGNRRISERYFAGGGQMFTNEYDGHPVWKPNQERIGAYLKEFESAIAQYQ